MSYFFIALVVIVLIYIFYKSRVDKKQQDEAELLLPQLVNQYKKEAVFLCRWADIFEGADSAIQMQGIITGDISNKSKIIGVDGSEHSIIEIALLTDNWEFDENYPDPVTTAVTGKKVLLAVSGGSWNLPFDTESSNKALFLGDKRYPEWISFFQKMKDEKVVVFNIK